MASGYQNSSGTDLDDIFDPYVQGSKPPATGYEASDDVDLNQRYAPIDFGTAAAPTGITLSNNADLNTLWAAKGTASYAVVASVSPTSISGETMVEFGSSQQGNVAPINIHVSEGNGPFNYSWEKVSGDNFSFSTIPPQGGAVVSYRASPFNVGSPTPGDTYSAVYRCRVSNAAGETLTNTTTINFTRYTIHMDAIGTYRAGGGEGYSVHGIELLRDGSCANLSETWVRPASATVGDKFEVRFEHISGSSVNSNPADGIWGVIDSRRYLNLEGTGSGQATVRVSIRGNGVGGITPSPRDFNLEIN